MGFGRGSQVDVEKRQEFTVVIQVQDSSGLGQGGGSGEK